MGFPHRVLLDSSPEDNNLPFTVIIPIVFVSTFLILSCYYFNIVWFFRRRGRTDVLETGSNQEERLNEEQSQVDHPIWHIRTIGLDESIINSIVICNYKKGEGLIETTDCAVCLTEFNENESLRLLPNCNHAFHVSCIDTWLRSHVSCPLCRSHILSRSQSTQIASTTPSLSHEEEQTNSQVNVDFESESESERRDSFGENQNSDEGTSSKCESSLVNPINCVEISISENHGNGENDRDFQTVRRSMSMDSCFTRSTMTIIDSNKEEDDDKDDDDEEEEEEKRIPEHFNLVELQEKEVFAKITENKKALDPGNNSSMRSFSSSRKLVFLRQGRSSNSILPL